MLPPEYNEKPISLSQFYTNWTSLGEHMTSLGYQALGATPMKQVLFRKKNNRKKKKEKKKKEKEK
jgi:hypothetical protein